MATNQNTPVLFPQPIAAQATSENINTIPNAATGTNLASFQEGFPALTRYPIIENPQEGQVSGIPPEQQDFNGLFFSVSSHTFFIQNGGSYTFNQNVSDAIGGYPMGAILWYAPPNSTPYQVQSLVGNNTYNFVENPSYINGVAWKALSSSIPVGTILAWSTTTAPNGYLICDGSAISRTTYAELFSVIGTTYGPGDGKTTFNLPNGGVLFGNNFPVVGNGITLGLTNGSGNFYGVTGYNGAGSATASFSLNMSSSTYGSSVGSYAPNISTYPGITTLGITTDPEKSGIIVKNNTLSCIIKY